MQAPDELQDTPHPFGIDEHPDVANSPSESQALARGRPGPVTRTPALGFAMGDDRARSYLSAIHTLKGHDNTDACKGSALAALRGHLDRLTCDDPDALIEVLAGQSLVLEHLTLTFFERAAKLTTIKPEAAVALAKVGLSSQAGFVRCHAAIAALKKQSSRQVGFED